MAYGPVWEMGMGEERRGEERKSDAFPRPRQSQMLLKPERCSIGHSQHLEDYTW